MANWKFFLDGNEVEEPIGWDAVEFTAIRMESHGIDQPFSTELRFYAEGARYIKSIYDQYFINQPIAITITSDVGYNNSAFQFDGFLNLSIYQEKNVCDTDSWEITVGIIDDEFREQFKSRQDVEIDLIIDKDLNGNAINPQVFDEIRLHKQDVYLVAQGGIPSGTGTSDVWEWNWVDGWSRNLFGTSRCASVLPIIWQTNDFKDQFGSALDYQGMPFTYTNVFFVNNQGSARTINISVSFDYTLMFYQAETEIYGTGNPTGKTMNADLTYMIVSGTNTIVSQTTVFVTPNVVYNTGRQPGSHSSTTTLTIQPGQRVIAMLQWGFQGDFVAFYPDYHDFPDWWTLLRAEITTSNICATLTEIYSGGFASNCQTLTIEKYLRRIIYKLTGSNNKLLSDAFDQSTNGCYWNNALTNGLRIRNAETIDQINYGCQEDPEEESFYQLKTTWQKTFENLDKIFCLGWAFEWTGTEWKIRVEPREYFYQNIISQSFENVGEVTQGVKADMLSNNITIGFSDNWKNIATSGAWAIHTDRNYFIANKAMNENSSGRLDLRSEIIAEGYAIEFSRRLINFRSDSASSDRPNDYEIFIIWLNRNSLVIPNVQTSEYAILDETGTKTFNPGEVSMSSNRITTSNSPLEAVYNVYHTPARIAGRWWKALGMHTYGMIQPIMQYQVGQYQTTYSSAIADSIEPCQEFPSNFVIQESTNIQSTLFKPEYQNYLFRPIEVTFSYPQSLCDFLTLSQDEQYKKVRLTSGSLVIEGFITSATNQPEDASGGTTQFTLLVSNQQSEPGGAFDAGFDDGYDNGG